MGENPWPWTLGTVKIGNWEFVAGTKLSASAFPKLYVPITSSGTTLDFSEAGHAGVPIVSSRALQVFDQFLNVSAVPIEVTSLQTESTEEFFVLVIEETRYALDTERSRFERFLEGDSIRPDLAGQIKSAYELRIDALLANGSRVFRLADGLGYLFVHDEVKRHIENLDLTGFHFIEA